MTIIITKILIFLSALVLGSVFIFFFFKKYPSLKNALSNSAVSSSPGLYVEEQLSLNFKSKIIVVVYQGKKILLSCDQGKTTFLTCLEGNKDHAEDRSLLTREREHQA